MVFEAWNAQDPQNAYKFIQARSEKLNSLKPEVMKSVDARSGNLKEIEAEISRMEKECLGLEKSIGENSV